MVKTSQLIPSWQAVSVVTAGPPTALPTHWSGFALPEASPFQQRFERCPEVVADAAADAPGFEQHDVVRGRGDEQVIEADRAKLID